MLMSERWARWRERLGLRQGLVLVAALAAAGLAVTSYEIGTLSTLEGQSVDARFAIRGPEPPQRDIAIVAVDEKTLKAINVRPPIPRIYYARALDKLRSAHPALIAIDVQFIGRTDLRDDMALRAALARDGPVVLATHEAADGPLAVPAGVRHPAGVVLASASVEPDNDGVLRRMIYAPVALPTLAVRAAELLSRHTISPRRFPANHAWVDFRGPPGTFHAYSLIDVVNGRVAPRAFSGKAVLIGVTDPAGKDVFITAASSVPMSGVEFHANALATILNGFPLQPLTGGAEVALLCLLAAVPAVLTLRLGAARMLVAVIAIMAALLIAVQLSFDAGTIVSVPDAILALVLATVGCVAADAFMDRRQLRNLRRTFDLDPSPVGDFFISYRRGQSELASNTLRDGLARKWGDKRVFMDTDAIDYGDEWPDRLLEAVSACRAMLVVIGPQWLDARAPDGSRRLDDQRDWVRREITAAFERGDVVVVPVLHDGARPPREADLPDPIKPLGRCQVVVLTGRELGRWIADLDESIQRGRVRRGRRLRTAAT
jgi:CHASE2 domain-containing sensor protein